MYMPTQPRTPLADLIGCAETATLNNQREQAVRLWEQVLTLSPDEPRALNALGNWALRQGDARRARQLLATAAQCAPHEPAVQFNLAIACRAGGDLAAAVRHFDFALAADPYLVHAMFQKGLTLEALGMQREAALTFKDLLDCAPAEVRNSPLFEDVLKHARAAVQADDALLEQALHSRLSAASASGHSGASPRVTECVGALVGKQRIYVQQPTYLHVPRLPAIPFFDRALTPWIKTLEAATADILAELQALLAPTLPSFVPYVEIPAGQPKNQWTELDRSLDWSAHFLWRHGQRIDSNCQRCPATAALLDAMPMPRIAGRTPNAFFSVLRPGARIPPHTGVTNMRSVVHLALIVPPGCGFRVGAETRRWIEGEAWVFDDTIEHEAWNESSQLRAVLIFDAWNPYLAEDEHDDFRRVIDTIDSHYGRARKWGNG